MVSYYLFRLKPFFLLLLLLGTKIIASAQCPPNLDFEQGDFTGWTCYSGSFNGVVNMNPVPIPPTAGRHDIISAATLPARDQWGNFPRLCPNGSKYSIRMGLESTGTTADRVTYTFTIPAGQNEYSLIYHFAIVINNSGGHAAAIQPRLTVSVRNLTDNTTDTCSSFDIAYSNANPLPGFQSSPVNSNIKFRPWAANSINLDGNAGKTIEISFTSTGCGANGGSHFGYCYIDLNSECSSSFVGATYCPDDAFINVTAPSGYQSYVWWNDIYTTVLGTGQTINFTPPPPAGTIIKVELTPFTGYGCLDTLTAELLDTLTLQSVAGPDQLSCQNAPVQLGTAPRATYLYSWNPPTGLNDPNISNPIATPSVTTQYVVTTTTAGGGCPTTDTVVVNAAVIDTTLQVIGIADYCMADPQAAVLKVKPHDSIQWYLNNVAIPGANDTLYSVVQTGTYHATLFSFAGCTLTTSDVSITVNPSPTVGFTINSLSQCLSGNQFVFTDTSSIAFGTLQYTWNLGDGTIVTTPNVNHSYTSPGSYVVKLLVTSDKGCSDSISYTVHVFESPVAGFKANINELCSLNNQFVFTDTSSIVSGALQYRWTMGDGNFFTTKDVTHSYTVPGSYTVQLVVTSDKGCTDTAIFDITVNASPVAGFSTANPQQCFGNNQFDFINSSTIFSGTMQYLWTLGDGTTATTRDVTHSYSNPGDYFIKMVVTSDKGCADSSTINVKVLPYAIADFFVEPVCEKLRLPLTNRTINTANTPLNFLWDFGNGATSTEINPVYSYPVAGNYTIKLSVNSNLCPLTVNTKQFDIVIDAPVAGIRYADKEAIMNFPEQLQARNIGSSVTWSPGFFLDNRYSYKPYFRSIDPQLYTIQLKTLTGCLTVDTQLVKTRKKIEIYVPTVFTPGNGGENDYLRPLLMSFLKVNYFRVYNRWGKLLFATQTDRPGWDGRVNGQLAETQTVVWMIEAVDVDGNVHRKQGTTVLMH